MYFIAAIIVAFTLLLYYGLHGRKQKFKKQPTDGKICLIIRKVNFPTFLILYFFQDERILIVEIKGGPYMKLKNLPTLTYTNIHICNYRAWVYLLQTK